MIFGYNFVFTFRPNTCDYNVFAAINQLNEYRLPECFAPENIIIDIGAHVGSFSYACLQRGVGKVLVFETEAENYHLACRHLAGFEPRVEISQLAVWRSDRPVTTLQLNPYPWYGQKINTGGSSVVFPATPSERESFDWVKTISFDALLRRHERVRLVKLDCEGSEWPILFTSKMLDRVDSLCGEYHELGRGGYHTAIPDLAKVAGYERYTADVLKCFLKQYYDYVEVIPRGDPGLGLFWASRAPIVD